MVDIRFYHLQDLTTQEALPLLIEKSLQRQLRTMVVASNDQHLSQLSQALWTYQDDSFLPHGLMTDAFADRQPVLLSTNMVNLNQAKILFLTDQSKFPDTPDQYTIIANLFDHNDQEAMQLARSAWKTLKDQYHLTYWQQISRKWVKQAETQPSTSDNTES